MRGRSFRLHDGQRGAALAVRVTPRARKNEIVEVLSDGTVKVHLTAPPVEGKANQALLEYGCRNPPQEDCGESRIVLPTQKAGWGEIPA
jgi:hypothetical protein